MPGFLKRPDWWLGFGFAVTVGTLALWLSGALGGSGSNGNNSSPSLASDPSGSVAAAPSAAAAVASSSPGALPARDAAPGASGPSTANTPSAWVDRSGLAARVRAIARTSGAAVGVAVRPLDGGPVLTSGPLQAGAAWSTMKVPVVLARYRLAAAAGAPTAPLDSRAALAITESDNEAIDSLFAEIAAAQGGVVPASRYLQSLLEGAGDTHTVVNTVPPPGGFSTFGQTQWSLSEGTRFYAALARGCLTPVAAAQRIQRLMGEIVPAQSWGLGAAHFRGPARVLFKGGWGPDSSGRYLVRQFGIVRTPGGHGLAVGVIDRPTDGTFASGVAVVDQLADAVAASVDPGRAPEVGACG